MKTGWYNRDNEFWTVTPLHNGHRQSFVLGAIKGHRDYWIVMLVCDSNCTAKSIRINPIISTMIESTNKTPSFKMLPLAISKLQEVEKAIAEKETRKRYTIRIDGLDELRLRVYEKALKKYKCGYKKSSVLSDGVWGEPTLQKTFYQKSIDKIVKI